MRSASARAIVEQTLHRVAPEVDAAGLEEDAPIHEAADLDSLDFLSFVTAVGDAVGVEVPERDYPSLASVAGCVRYLTTRA